MARVAIPERRIITNEARCRRCGDVVESLRLAHHQTCQCGNLTVAGGHYYLKRLFDHPDSWDELSTLKDLPKPVFFRLYD